MQNTRAEVESSETGYEDEPSGKRVVKALGEFLIVVRQNGGSGHPDDIYRNGQRRRHHKQHDAG